MLLRKANPHALLRGLSIFTVALSARFEQNDRQEPR